MENCFTKIITAFLIQYNRNVLFGVLEKIRNVFLYND